MAESSATEAARPVEPSFELWREAMTQLRHLSDEFVQSARFCLALNAPLLIGSLVFLQRQTFWVIAVALSVLGIAFTIGARYVLKRHRIYYLQMLAKKALLEDALGFYRTTFPASATNYVLPWALSADVVARVRQDTEAWVRESIRAKGTIARVYFLMHEVLIAIYVLTAAAALVRLNH